ncbi:exocyst complex component Sec10 [Hesseltinella vesiculosa]|uniref:Exocyst complex component Sec10 n=1 Tax=Hesseltinella vesiculosa TaxID=101127 RepID=A0A1X2G5H8_9FUNG|nr:exocyst complex component Sec10 [Hesseltinella vesiculosa]
MASRPNMYSLEADIKELLTINQFKEGYSTDDFVEAISAKLMSRMETVGGNVVLDPKPFVRTFEQVLEELQLLRVRIQHQCDELELGTQNVEQQYKKKVTDMRTSFKDVYRSFDGLELRISDVGKTAVRIGEQLETLDRQRSRAAESRDVIEYFMEFQDGHTDRLDILRYESGEEGQLKAAVIAKRLNAVAKNVDNDTKARDAIEKFCESFEKEMLEEFDKAYRDCDPRVMAHCARVLFEFNGGSSCMQIYVNQHEFFISSMQSHDADGNQTSIDAPALANPYIHPPEVDTSVIKLYDAVRMTIRREAEIISAVFPQPTLVIEVFLHRIFAQSIQDQVESLFPRSQRISNLAYLRTLARTHAATKRLVDSLKAYCEKELTDSSTSLDDTGLATATSLDDTLHRCMNDLFVPYTEGNRYLAKEQLCLNELFGSIIAEFLNFMQQYKKTSARNQSVLARTLNQISSSPLGTSFGDVNDIAASPTAMSPLAKPSGISSNLEQIEGTGFSLLSQDAILRILRIHSEAILRCVELTPKQELPVAIKQLYDILLDFMGTKYLDILLDEIYDELGHKSEPDTVCFSVLSTTTNISQLLQQHFQSAVIPLVVAAPSIHRDTLASKNRFFTTLEKKINYVLLRSTDAVQNWLTEILNRQKRNDFRPKDEDVMMMSNGTPPCVSCVEFLTKIYRGAVHSLQGKNLESYLLTVGNQFHTLLLEHFKKFMVTPTGGLLVTKDIAKYQEAIEMFKISTLNDRFEMLRQVGNIFVVKPEILRSILSEGYLARLDPAVLYPYLEKRVDFKSASLDRVLGYNLAGAGAGATTTSSPNTTTREQKSAQRRSLFVNENKVLKDMMKSYAGNKEFLSAFQM